jgi:hypothetical protein
MSKKDIQNWLIYINFTISKTNCNEKKGESNPKKKTEKFGTGLKLTKLKKQQPRSIQPKKNNT